TYFQDELYINGEKIEEHYLEPLREDSGQMLMLDETLFDMTGETSVPEDTYFVLGDNRVVSKDSRVFGFIPAAQIEGTADLRLWPLNKIGIIADNGAEE
ncbi:MAG: signal peptidase I, partial [Trichococcus flocculiformis]